MPERVSISKFPQRPGYTRRRHPDTEAFIKLEPGDDGYAYSQDEVARSTLMGRVETANMHREAMGKPPLVMYSAAGRYWVRIDNNEVRDVDCDREDAVAAVRSMDHAHNGAQADRPDAVGDRRPIRAFRPGQEIQEDPVKGLRQAKAKLDAVGKARKLDPDERRKAKAIDKKRERTVHALDRYDLDSQNY